MHQKKGQFYIIAAAIIIMIIFGLVATKNKAVFETKPIKFYDLSRDYEAETSKVIDYGVYNKYTSAVDIAEKVENISQVFAKQGEVKGMRFDLTTIYGNSSSISIVNNSYITNEVSVSQGSIIYNLITLTSSQQSKNPGENTVNVTVSGQNYEFELGEEDNFYFVIASQIKGETHVVLKDK